MTYNILDGGTGREEYIIEILQTVQPDIVILQEVFHEKFIQDLAQLLSMESFVATGNTKRNLAILSRLPIVSRHSYHPFPPIRRTILEVKIEYAPGKNLSILGVHLVPWHSVLLELWRWWEIKVVIQRAKLYSKNPCLVVGDFNAIAPYDKVCVAAMPLFLKLMVWVQGRRVYRFVISEMLKAGFTDCYRALHPNDDGYTLPSVIPNVRLDYIFANQLMKASLKKCFVVREPISVPKASDHCPVVAEFAI